VGSTVGASVGDGAGGRVEPDAPAKLAVAAGVADVSSAPGSHARVNEVTKARRNVRSKAVSRVLALIIASESVPSVLGSGDYGG
jgi:hypothetical protein